LIKKLDLSIVSVSAAARPDDAGDQSHTALAVRTGTVRRVSRGFARLDVDGRAYGNGRLVAGCHGLWCGGAAPSSPGTLPTIFDLGDQASACDFSTLARI